jgi:hypothetical protein
MAIESNVVTINCPLITDIQYIADSFDITGGQASSPPPTIEQSGADWTITIGANRQNSSQVAQTFNKATGGVSGGVIHSWSRSAVSDREPAELNFCFGLDLSVETSGQTVTVTIYLGQGNTGFPAYSNNWWIGSQYLVSPGPGVGASLTVLGETYYVTGGNNSFNLVPPYS